jgi:diaminohydroxyphosphoribosylaminopyrimidine deaminase/5-amino-6-(5-phosphoribosylamino)uracil reductase
VTLAADQRHMRRAIALARARLGLTGDNPSVGCVIVKDGAVIAEAATADGGRPHAEEQALAYVGAAAADADVFLTMEPCGERSNGTASCSERLAAAKVRRVVFACGNLHALSAGRGPARLGDAGVSLQAGFLEAEAAFLYVDR